MSRALLILSTNENRERAVKWVQNAPQGTRLEFKSPQRSSEQNSLMWSLLTDVSRQYRHHGRLYDTSVWKSLFMHAWGREVDFVPALESDGELVPVAYSSSDLSKQEMAELLDWIVAWGTQHDIKFSEPRT